MSVLQVYDLNGDGFITREEMVQWLKTSMIKQTLEDDQDEGLKELIETILKKLDCVDHDNKVSLADFQQAVKNDNLLLESLAPCMPPAEYKKSFLLLISGDCTHTIAPNNYRPLPPIQPNYLAVLSANKAMAKERAKNK
ncbi:hypothetical protein BaRGS_00029837 [Batillaria attramentaria]|uniref:EF-hand domain-containing protein n=1 Tax=Batillaria attramentaria TaxID=370345 RepID=A0ABD0JV43_9CAEN